MEGCSGNLHIAGVHEIPETDELNDYNISNADNWWSKD